MIPSRPISKNNNFSKRTLRSVIKFDPWLGVHRPIYESSHLSLVFVDRCEWHIELAKRYYFSSVYFQLKEAKFSRPGQIWISKTETY